MSLLQIICLIPSTMGIHAIPIMVGITTERDKNMYYLKSIEKTDGEEITINRRISDITFYDAQSHGEHALKNIDRIIREETFIDAKLGNTDHIETIETIKGFTLTATNTEIYVPMERGN